MMTRVLLCGICLIGIHAGSGIAQTFESRSDSPVTDKPAAVDGTLKTPTTIPEIIRQPDGDENEDPRRPRPIADPGFALAPPVTDLPFLRAIRLDWERKGEDTAVPGK